MSGRFVWFELITSDVEGGIAFWSDVAGFRREDSDMGTFRYPVLTVEGRGVAGAMAPKMPDVPSHWMGYWGVDDVDARAARVAAAGGRILVPPTDIPTVGRFAIVADPQGASVSLFRPAGEERPNTAFHWMELWTPDPEAAARFWSGVLDLATDEMAMPSGPYHLLKADGVSVAGIMRSDRADVPPMWLPYVVVDDVDAAVGRVERQGGAVHAAPMAVPGVGRFAIVADRQRAALGLIVPAPPSA